MSLNSSYSRVKKLVSGRRAGTVSLKQFKAEIERFSTDELAELAAVLFEQRFRGETSRKPTFSDVLPNDSSHELARIDDSKDTMFGRGK